MSKIVHRPPSSSALLEQKFLTVAELAAILRTSTMTVYRMIATGELDARRFGRSYRIPETAAAKLLAEGTPGDA